MLIRSVSAARRHAALLDAEELLNSVTHGLAFVGACVGGVLLIVLAWMRADAWAIAGVCIYSVSMVFLFAASTVYHGVTCTERKRRMRRVDHFGVTLLIAGTYTPFVFADLRSGPAVWIGPVVWGLLALCLILQFILSEQNYYRVSLPLYVVMGFVCLPFGPSVIAALPTDALWMLAAGGVAYVVGVVFFVWESLPFSHGVWHVCVMVGAALHFGAVATCSGWGVV
ncbi:MAG: hemolysin III [Bradymonadia bacterium]|jgi:hemolysin III